MTDEKIEEVLKELLTVSDAAELGGVTRSYIYYLINTREVKVFEIGKKKTRLVKKADILKFKNSRGQK